MVDNFDLILRMARDSAGRPEWRAFKESFTSTGQRDERNGYLCTSNATPATFGALDRLGAQGLMFYGHHGATMEYNAHAFYGIDNEFEWCDAMEDGCPAICVVVEGSKGAQMMNPKRAIRFTNQLARVTVLVDHSWKPDDTPKKPRLRVV